MTISLIKRNSQTPSPENKTYETVMELHEKYISAINRIISISEKLHNRPNIVRERILASQLKVQQSLADKYSKQHSIAAEKFVAQKVDPSEDYSMNFVGIVNDDGTITVNKCKDLKE